MGVDVSAESDEDVDAVCVAAWVVDKGLWRLSAVESATAAGALARPNCSLPTTLEPRAVLLFGTECELGEPGESLLTQRPG